MSKCVRSFSVTETESEALWVLWFYWVKQSLSFRMKIYFLVVRKFYVARLWEIEKGLIDPSVFQHFYEDMIQIILTQTFLDWDIYCKVLHIMHMSYNCSVYMVRFIANDTLCYRHRFLIKGGSKFTLFLNKN